MSASSRIRASIESLPEHQRGEWDYQIRSLHMDGTSDGRVAPITGGPAIAHIPTGHTGAYIALMGPHVGEKVAALLEARRAETTALLIELTAPTRANIDAAEEAAHALTRAFADLEIAIEGEQR